MKKSLPGIGMRKVKSLLAIAMVFMVWQVVRVWFPQFNPHPLFGYVYAIIEMRESVEKTSRFGRLRIKATFLGLAIGLMALPLSEGYGAYAGQGVRFLLTDLAIILTGVLITLWLAELFGCKNFCGIAAVIFVICLVRDRNTDINIYLYAILRVFQTLLGVFSAWVINRFIAPRYEGNNG